MKEVEQLYLDDLHVGRRFTSGSYLMEAAAETSIFKGLAASGWHTAAAAMRLLVTGGLPFASGMVGSGGEIAFDSP